MCAILAAALYITRAEKVSGFSRCMILECIGLHHIFRIGQHHIILKKHHLLIGKIIPTFAGKYIVFINHLTTIIVNSNILFQVVLQCSSCQLHFSIGHTNSFPGYIGQLRIPVVVQYITIQLCTRTFDTNNTISIDAVG